MQTSFELYVDAQFTSPYAMSVYVALLEKGLPFEVTTVDLDARENKGAQYAALSLTSRVPTLQRDGLALSESSAITEYLDEVFEGASLYPHDPVLKARARQVQAWLRSDLLPIRHERDTQVIFYGARRAPLSDAALDATRKLFSAAEALLPEGADNLFGNWSIADVDLAVMLNRLALHGDPVPQRLAAYAHAQWQRPSVQQWVNQVRPPL